jgi:phosphoribosylformylglycinamidine (FGAM) synthase PurS component
MQLVEFAIDLSVPDNTAFTVLVALRGLGYEAIERVERSELLRLDLREGAMSIDDCTQAILRAEIVFNPNKHRLAFRTAGESDRFEAVVEDNDDDTDALKTMLATRFGVAGLDRVSRATSWRLTESGRPAGPDRLEWACKNLLANPFSQHYVVRKRPEYAGVQPRSSFLSSTADA